MNLNEIIEEREELIPEGTEDLAFNLVDIGKSFDNTSKLIKWIDRKAEWRNFLREKELEKAKIFRKNYNFLKDMKLPKDELLLQIITDPKYCETMNEIMCIKEAIRGIEYVIRELHKRKMNIKRAVDYLNFKNGRGKNNE